VWLSSLSAAVFACVRGVGLCGGVSLWAALVTASDAAVAVTVAAVVSAFVIAVTAAAAASVAYSAA
jgi:hypothetical protein